MEKVRFVSNGDIYTCNMGNIDGSIQGGDRLCLVVANNKACAYSPIIHVCPLTSQSKNNFLLHYKLSKDVYSFLNEDSLVLCEQYQPINKKKLGKKLGQISLDDLIIIVDKCKMNLPY